MEMQHHKDSKEKSGGIIVREDGVGDLKPSETDFGMKLHVLEG
jgi:hypothetical protein